MEVYLEERVFMSISMAAAEVYKHESYGCLLGYKLDNAIIVDNAIPYQSADRGFFSVDLKAKQRNIIKKILNTFPKLNIIGEFHSHPQYGNVKGDVILSDNDTKNVDSGKLEIVIAINDKKRSKSWTYNKDMTISGTFADYHIRMASYIANKVGYNGAKKPERINMWCPIVTSKDYLQQRQAI